MKVKVFSATKAGDRHLLGEKITAWIQQSGAECIEATVRQSSDSEYHCLSIVIWYK